MSSLALENNESNTDNLIFNNNFTENEKRILHVFTKFIEKNNVISPQLSQILNQGLLFIGVCKGDAGLVAWSLRNGADPSKSLDSRTMNVIRSMGIVIPELEEVFSNQSNNSNNNSNNNSLDPSIISSLNTFKAGEDILSENCVICTDLYKKDEFVIKLDCKHNFHKKCLLKWFDKDDTCPLCRNVVK